MSSIKAKVAIKLSQAYLIFEKFKIHELGFELYHIRLFLINVFRNDSFYVACLGEYSALL